MKNLLLLPAILLISIAACSQPSHPNSPHDTVRTANIKVTYGRPYKKGREIFGKLEPYGKVYRVGADEATTISFAKDGTFGGKPVKAGTYTLFAIPNASSWTVILNSQLGQWGAFSYDKYKDKDVLHVDVPVKKVSPPIEQLTIRFPASAMVIEWDDTQVSVPVKF
ncbi:MAG TPA: DUF2911 domain-containing protein [Puia sp.]|nr:DUF2911 domain-containing protein [Puia sp.]